MGLFQKKHVCGVCQQVIKGTYYPISNAATKEFLYDLCIHCKTRYVAATNKNSVPIDPAVIRKSIESAKNSKGIIEVKVHCNTCNNVYCYTDQDLIRNIELAEKSKSAAKDAVFNALFVSYMTSNQKQEASDRYLSQVVDYKKCPKCGSENVVLYDEKVHLTQQKVPQSNADELKKFKDLLDSGVITQEEFDKKKKQLLGL